jgi:hypothetical protein
MMFVSTQNLCNSVYWETKTLSSFEFCGTFGLFCTCPSKIHSPSPLHPLFHRCQSSSEFCPWPFSNPMHAQSYPLSGFINFIWCLLSNLYLCCQVYPATRGVSSECATEASHARKLNSLLCTLEPQPTLVTVIRPHTHLYISLKHIVNF